MIYVIILLCGLEALKYYFKLLYQEYEELKEEIRNSKPDEDDNKEHHIIK